MCRSPFVSSWGVIPEATLWEGMALLARWFRFQPSEIDALSLEELVGWMEQAGEQIKREHS